MLFDTRSENKKGFSHVGHERVGEVVFIPVYDRSYPHSGVRAVMEVMLQKGAAETMAEVITYISSALNLLQVCECPCNHAPSRQSVEHPGLQRLCLHLFGFQPLTSMSA